MLVIPRSTVPPDQAWACAEKDAAWTQSSVVGACREERGMDAELRRGVDAEALRRGKDAEALRRGHGAPTRRGRGGAPTRTRSCSDAAWREREGAPARVQRRRRSGANAEALGRGHGGAPTPRRREGAPARALRRGGVGGVPGGRRRRRCRLLAGVAVEDSIAFLFSYKVFYANLYVINFEMILWSTSGRSSVFKKKSIAVPVAYGVCTPWPLGLLVGYKRSVRHD
jgi:hypothetical protein